MGLEQSRQRSSTPITIGQLSRRSGVSVRSLREYTDLGLIDTLGRSPANYRLYTGEALWCVQVIGQLRGLGLTVAEIVELTREHSDGDARGADPRDRDDSRRDSGCAETRSAEPRLARLLRHSRRRLEQRIAADRRTLARIDEFEATHHAELARHGGVCWLGRPGSASATPLA